MGLGLLDESLCNLYYNITLTFWTVQKIVERDIYFMLVNFIPNII